MHRAKYGIVSTGGWYTCLAVSSNAPECAAITIACDAACGCYRWHNRDAAHGERTGYRESDPGYGVCALAAHYCRDGGWRSSRFSSDRRFPAEFSHSPWYTGRMWYYPGACHVG